MATEIKEGSSTVTAEPTANNAVPRLITPNGETGLRTALQWNGFLGLTQVAGPNGATSTTTFDASARKSGTTSPHGAPTAYSYTYQPNTVTPVTTTVPGGATRKRFARTTMDGFGRTIKEETGSGDPAASHQVLSIVDTEYGPCAGSPLGKLKRVR